MLSALFTYVILGGLIYWGLTGAWKILTFACNAIVWVVGALFTIVGSLTDYVTETIQEIPEDHKVKRTIQTKPDNLNNFVDWMIANERADVSHEVLHIKKRLNEASRKGETIIMSQVEDSEGKLGTANVKFVEAGKYDEKIQNAFDNGKIYIKNIDY